jgi:O-succinylbenzoic acid--CoA ligase
VSTHDPVQFWARAQPDRVALQSARSTWTYAMLDQAVWASADALLGRGLGSGEHLSLEFDPTDALHFAVTFHALHRVGLLPVPIGAQATVAERQAQRERAQVEFTLTADDLTLEEPKPNATPKSSAKPKPSPEPEPEVDENALLTRRLDAPAAVCFTSGTSGEPRAAILTHGNFLWSAIASARNLGVLADDLWLCCLPLHHVGGLSILTRSAAYGTGVLIHERFVPEAVNEAIDRDGVTLTSLVPTMLRRLLAARRGRPFPARLRAALIGGGPAAPDLLEEATALRLRALPTYGLTEATSQVTTLSLDDWPNGLDTAGRPIPYTRVEIRNDDDRPVGPGVEGEIVVRGPTIMAGYLGDPPATAEALAGRWLRTGDVGTWDRGGRLIVLDRREDRIVTGGENVSPSEVERALLSHPAVEGACVVAIPSGEWGQEVAAAVELKPGGAATLEEMRAHMAATLSGFKLPRHLMVVSTLPRSASGKLLRRLVRDRFLDEVAKQKHP